ncbi:MAG: hypothetical protein F4X51_00285 [Gemmatimonadetes bacterium]|nr:hypothetical protein [Gemmatimonadota bacterium]
MPDNPYIGITIIDKETKEDKFSVIIDVKTAEDGAIVYDPRDTERPKRYDISITEYTPGPDGLETKDILNTF